MLALTKWADHSMMLPYNKQVSWIAEEAGGQISAHLALYEAHFAKTGCKYLAGDDLTAAGEHFTHNGCQLSFESGKLQIR